MSPARALLVGLLVCPFVVCAEERLDPEFWKAYEPYDQYDEYSVRDLRSLGERDLLASHPRANEIVIRVFGRGGAFSKLISARISVNEKHRGSVTVKVLPYSYPHRDGPLRAYSSAVSADRVSEFLALIDRYDFWNAPREQKYVIQANGFAEICVDGGGWMIEGVTRDVYQQISRVECADLEAGAQEIRDFLLELVHVRPHGRR